MTPNHAGRTDAPADGPGQAGASAATRPSGARRPDESTITALLRRIETKIDALTHRAAEPAVPPPDPYRGDLLVRRIESAEQHLARRMDAGFASASTEARVLEDMLRGLAAKVESRNGAKGAEVGVEAIEQALAKIGSRLDRLVDGPASAMMPEGSVCGGETPEQAVDPRDAAGPTAAEATRGAAGERVLAREIALLRAARTDADRELRASMAALQEKLETIAGSLAKLESDPARPEPGRLLGRSSTGSAFLFRPVLGRDTIQARAAPPGPARPENGDSAEGPGPDGTAEILLEPGSGPPPAQSLLQASGTACPPFVGNVEEDQGRADYIAAARRAARAARGGTTAEATPAAREDGGATAGGRKDGPGGVRRLVAAYGLRILAGAAILALAAGAYLLLETTRRGTTPIGADPVQPSRSGTLVKPKDPARAPNGAGRAPASSPLWEPMFFSPGSVASAEFSDPRPARAVAASDPIVKGAIGTSDGPRPVLSAEGAESLVPAEATHDLVTKARSGDPVAQYELGVMLAEGRIVPRDFEHAAHWLAKAAAQGSAPARYRLAILHEKGQGVAPDVAAAATLYRQAAEQGNIRAMHNLGVLAAKGRDGTPNYAEAATWFEKAAEYGVRDSQFNIAVLLAHGFGRPRDLVRSHVWFSIVAETGDAEAARKRDDLARELTTAELAAARALATAFEARSIDPQANESTEPRDRVPVSTRDVGRTTTSSSGTNRTRG